MFFILAIFLMKSLILFLKLNDKFKIHMILNFLNTVMNLYSKLLVIDYNNDFAYRNIQ